MEENLTDMYANVSSAQFPGILPLISVDWKREAHEAEQRTLMNTIVILLHMMLTFGFLYWLICVRLLGRSGCLSKQQTEELLETAKTNSHPVAFAGGLHSIVVREDGERAVNARKEGVNMILDE